MIVDIILIVILAVSVISGYKKGLVKALLRFFNIFIFMVLFALLHEPIAPYFGESGGGAVATTIAAVIISSAVEFVLCKIVKLPILNQVNKLLGGCLGIVNGAILVVALSFVCTYYEALAPYAAESMIIEAVLTNIDSFIIQAADMSGLF